MDIIPGNFACSGNRRSYYGTDSDISISLNYYFIVKVFEVQCRSERVFFTKLDDFIIVKMDFSLFSMILNTQ